MIALKYIYIVPQVMWIHRMPKLSVGKRNTSTLLVNPDNVYTSHSTFGGLLLESWIASHRLFHPLWQHYLGLRHFYKAHCPLSPYALIPAHIPFEIISILNRLYNKQVVTFGLHLLLPAMYTSKASLKLNISQRYRASIGWQRWTSTVTRCITGKVTV